MSGQRAGGPAPGSDGRTADPSSPTDGAGVVPTSLTPPEVAELSEDALGGWDAHTVDVAGGDVYQSRAWAEYRARHGWSARFLATSDGGRVLALVRPWPLVGGAGAYISRGPVAAGSPPEVTAARLVAVARWLGEHGVDVVASDAEVPADIGYGELLADAGFSAIEELQPSRHRLAVDLPPEATEHDLLMAVDMTTRQRIRKAARAGLRVVRYDQRLLDEPGEGFEAPAPEDLGDASAAAFARLYELLQGTAARRAFRLGAREPFLDWGRTGLEDGRIVLLETLDPDGETLGAAMFYRHGGRLTYSHSADRADRRRTHPGVAHLQLWRAIQLAHREGLAEVDLGGVDVPGARRRPTEGEPMYGLYAFKRSFDARWVELTGARQWVARPWRYALGRVSGRIFAGLGRR
jgi:lipid II:glycine glycyltransferase (peptidoglycan interpeptide bridge formation enzyme)